MGLTSDFINMKRSKGTALLYLGVYCGGLILTGSVEVEFMPGIYIIKDGVFEVSGNAGAEGEYRSGSVCLNSLA